MTTNKSAASVADFGLLVLRVVFGGLLAAHGAQKLFGWFEGPGWDQTSASFENMGYNPGKFFGPLAGATELGGGLLLLLGLATPLAAAAFLGVMINAVHATWDGGLLTGKGYEMPLLFAAVGAAMAFTGPGRYSLDRTQSWVRPSLVVAGGSIALAVVTAVASLIFKSVL